MKRFKESRRARGKTFGRTASRTHKRNVMDGPMRGGIRL